MKEEFERYVSDILQSLEIDATFEVYDCVAEMKPLVGKLIGIDGEYLICCEDNPDTRRIEKFIGKQIYSRNGIIYWFEGERATSAPDCHDKSPTVQIKQKRSFRTLKDTSSHVCLPEWIDNQVFYSFDALYAPSGNAREFDNNLNLSKDQLKIYLGTYFPRSFAETYSIFNNLFSNPTVLEKYDQQKAIEICSVGAGTGGDLLGLLTAISNSFKMITNVSITAIEGNEDALAIAGSLIVLAKQHYGFDVKLMSLNHIFANVEAAEKLISRSDIQYDFVLTSKLLNELISSGNRGCGDSYYDFARCFLPYLKSEGFCLILDITSKANNLDEFYPRLLNEQINRALQEMDEFKTLLPLSCSLYERQCSEKCFTQKSFFVTHSQQIEDRSKVCYRLIGRSDFVDQISPSSFGFVYAIVDDGSSVCKHSGESCGESATDSFLLEKPIERQNRRRTING
jgi:hypothetical protein